MANRRKSSMHEKLGDEAMEAIDQELKAWPLGYSDFTGLYEEMGIEAKGVPFSTFWRHASYRLEMFEDAKIRDDISAGLDGADLDGPTMAALRTRFYVTIKDRQSKTKDIVNLAAADSAITKRRELERRMAEQERKMAEAVSRSAEEEKRDPHMALENLREAAQTLYGVKL